MSAVIAFAQHPLGAVPASQGYHKCLLSYTLSSSIHSPNPHREVIVSFSFHKSPPFLINIQHVESLQLGKK